MFAKRGFRVLVLILLSLGSLRSEEVHHHRLEEEVDLIEKAEEMLKSLRNEISDYLNYREKLKKENETLLKEIQEFDSWGKEDERFKAALQELEHDFMKFREKLSQFVAETDSYSPHACTLRAMSILSATEWYVGHIKSMAFPESWKQSEIHN